MSELGQTLTGLFPFQLTGTPGKGGLPVQEPQGPCVWLMSRTGTECFPTSSNT